MSNEDTIGIGFGPNGIEVKPMGLRIKESEISPLEEALSMALSRVANSDGLHVSIPVSHALVRKVAFDALATLVSSVSPGNPAYDLVWETANE